MDLESDVALSWPVFVMLGGLILLFFILDYLGYGKRERGIGVIIFVISLVLLYNISILRRILRWALTMVAFAAPLALSVISIEYLVEET